MTDDLVKRVRRIGIGSELGATTRDRTTAQEAADRIEMLEATLRKGQYMRQRQKQYFKDRTQDNLVGSKQAEVAFDKAACAALEGEKKDG